MTARRSASACRFLAGGPAFVLVSVLALLLPSTARAAIFTNISSSTFAPGSTLNYPSTQGGLAFADFDNDGRLDFVAVNDYGDAPQVFKNMGPNTNGVTYFQEQLTGFKGVLPADSNGFYPDSTVVVGDYDNDGDVDIFATDASTGKGAWAYENNLIDNGNGTPKTTGAFMFYLVTTEVGLDKAPTATDGIALLDLEGDGDLDVVFDDSTSGGVKKLFINQLITGSLASYGFLAASSGQLADTISIGHDLATLDINLDGYTDLYSRSAPPTAANASAEVFYFNDKLGNLKDAVGNGVVISPAAATFTSSSGINNLSTAWGDYNQDGLWDLLIQNNGSIINTVTYPTRFYVASKDSSGNFNLVDKNGSSDLAATVPTTGGGDGGGGVLWGDVDNDGRLDLFVGQQTLPNPDLLYLNKGPADATKAGNPGIVYQLQQQSAGQEADISNFTKGNTDAAALVDWDNDGDLDLYLNNAGANDAAFQNGTASTSAKNYLRVRVTCYKRDCVGATVQLYKGGDSDADKIPDVYVPGYPGGPSPYNSLSTSIVPGSLVATRQVSGGMGIGAQDPFVLHFGLPATLGPTAYYTVRVVFPGGKVILKDVQPSTSSAKFGGFPDTTKFQTLAQFVAIDIGDKSEDGDGLPASVETTLLTDAYDLDSDDDGLSDWDEVVTYKTDPAKQDTDLDGLPDGLELGLQTGVPDLDGSGALKATDATKFKGDTVDKGAATTDPLKKDSDGDGLVDGYDATTVTGEDKNLNGNYDDKATGSAQETDPMDVDTDDDGIYDGSEVLGYTTPCTGGQCKSCPVSKGSAPSCSVISSYKSDPRLADTDADGLKDGLEVGLQVPMDSGVTLPKNVKGTNTQNGAFAADTVDKGAKTTNPSNADTDGDALQDGAEDRNSNGSWDTANTESDPTQWSSDSGCDGDGYELSANPATNPLDGNDDSCSDPDADGLTNAIEVKLGTSANDADSDDDGISDGAEDANKNGVVESTETNPALADTDSDGIQDGTELGYTTGLDNSTGKGTNPAKFVPDADPTTKTNPRSFDTDGDGILDGTEDLSHNGKVDAKESDPADVDTDDDGLADNVEDFDKNGVQGLTETAAYNYDSDSDGLPDGLELKVTSCSGSGTDTSKNQCQIDTDTSTGTNPLVADTDGDLLVDGIEDQNKNGKVDKDGGGKATETDPNKLDSDADGLKDGLEDFNHNGAWEPKDATHPETDPLNADTDADGLLDGIEDKNSSGTVDKDLNGKPTETDPLNPDSDGDGILDGTEDANHDGQVNKDAFGNPTETDPLNPDSDGDGLTDGFEDKNQNGKVDEFETDPRKGDSDSDGLTDGDEVNTYSTNPLAKDSDADGLDDNIEVLNNCKLDPNNADTDGDGLLDGIEDPTKDCRWDPDKLETNPLDYDSDDDGVSDGDEDKNHNGKVDKDGGGKATETDPLIPDSDGDQILDGTELGYDASRLITPVNPNVKATETDVFVADADPSTTTNPLSTDTDADGLLDNVEDKNFNGKVDRDGSGNALETDPNLKDSDADGLNDGVEDSDHSGAVNGKETDPLLYDTDGGCEGDGSEVSATRNPLDPTDDSCADADGDGISNELEVTFFHSDPFDADSDDDGILDGNEPGLVDLNNDKFKDGWTDANGDGSVDEHDPDVDGDGLNSILDPDSDNDGVLDGTEMGRAKPDTTLDGAIFLNPDGSAATNLAHKMFFADADPSTTTDPNDADTDGGGADDGAEDPNHNGRLDEDELDPNSKADDPKKSGTTQNCESGTEVQDTDCDGLTDLEEQHQNTGKAAWVNPLDADSDDDGVIDGDEDNWTLDTDGDGMINVRDVDSDNDGLLDGTEKGVADASSGTDLKKPFFVADADPGTTTSMVNRDTDFGGADDGAEDPDHNGSQLIDDLDSENSELDPNDASDDPLKSGTTSFCENGTYTQDTDCDGLTDREEDHFVTNPNDADSDDDGMMDGLEDNWTADTDQDGVIDAMDCDSDDDDILDGTERGVTKPVGTKSTGTNVDNGCYKADDEPETKTIMVSSDTDGGLTPDGVEDVNQNGKRDKNSTGAYTETDPNDPIDDCTDTDEDGLCNTDEEANGTFPNDADSDDDGVIDSKEGTRESAWNDDFDGDGLINALDPDSDNDGVLDGTEVGVTDSYLSEDTDTGKGFYRADADPNTITDPCDADTDGDGISDGAEDPNHNGKTDDAVEARTTDCGSGKNLILDTDCDGLSDAEETFEGTRSADADSDDDGVLDGLEDNWTCDMDQDGKKDALDADSDADLVLDGTERGLTQDKILVDDGSGKRGGTDVSVGNFTPDEDPATTTFMVVGDTDKDTFTDGAEDCNLNGRVDCVETDPLDNASPSAGTVQSICTDQDHDGLTDYIELQLGTSIDNADSDSDGIPDYVEQGGDACLDTPVDTDGDGQPDAREQDSDNDGISDTLEAGKDDPTHPVDSDGDGMADYRDTDSDNDELSDELEQLYGTDRTDPDTDGGGVSDGDEVLVDHTSPFVGEDDNTGVRGGGCSTNDHGSPISRLSALAMLGLLILPTWRRRRSSGRSARMTGSDAPAGPATSAEPAAKRTSRHSRGLKLGLGLLMTLSVSPARAADDTAPPASDRFSAQTFRPALDMGSYLSVWDTDVIRQWNFDVGLSASYAYQPLVRRRLDTGEPTQEILGNLTTGEIFGGMGLTNFISLHLSFPVSYGTGRVPVPLEIDPGVISSYDEFATLGFGDAWLAAKLQVLSTRKSALGLAFIPEFSLPVGDTAHFFSERSPTFRLRLATEVDLKILRIGANAAYRIRSRAQVQDVLLDDTFEYGLAAKIPIIGGLDLSAELYGSLVARPFTDTSFTYDQNLTRDGTSPLEFLVAARYVTNAGLTATLGGGVGLTDGVGAPTYRVVAGFGYRSPLNLDEDGDGIPDRFDKCPKEPENFNGVMDEDGCPEPDTDGDGIVDPVDACPTAPEDFDGFQDEDGCPDLDNDGDGIPDAKDQCPNDPEDKDGYEDSDGCPDMDNDKDGIPDDKDKCPNQAEDFDGFEDEDGCPDPDNDSDGIPDPLDKCPNEPEDKDGFQDEDGCPDPDNDNDGILDINDKCPNEPEVINGVEDEDGCPDEGTQLVFVKEDRLQILFPVHFEVDRAAIRSDSETLLNQVGTTLKVNPYIKKIRIEGHTDSDGDDKHNLELSQARANSVMDYLIKQGVEPSRLEAVGYGETRPIASNKTTKGKEMNRRVDFIIIEREERIKLQKKKSTTGDVAPANPAPEKGAAAPDQGASPPAPANPSGNDAPAPEK